MKNKILYVSLFIVTIIIFFYKFLAEKNENIQIPIVAISQIIEHNTLDVVREGLIEGLTKAGYKNGANIQIVYENAHGNLAVASQIGQKFAALKPAILVALSTQSAQILQQQARSLQIPLVFSAVTDPTSAKLVKSWEKTDEGITGISDYMDAEPQLLMIKSFLPKLVRLGVLYNPSEVNSVSFLEKFEAIAHKMGIKIVRAALNNTSEAAAAIASLVGKVEAAYFPNDNTAMAAVGTIVSTGIKNNIPIFANDLASVQQGALAAVAYDRREMGFKTAEIVIGLLGGKSTAHFNVTNKVNTEVVVNGHSLKQLELSMPQSSLHPIRNVCPE